MNSLTVNLHLLLGAFYRPDGARSVVRHHGRDPAACIVRVPHGADFAAAVAELGDRCCVVLVGALQYYSGEWYDAKALADAAHGAGAVLGLDCAHAAGNVPLALHADGVDFACWCSYKYLNSGPGALAGAFVHDKHDTRALDGALRGWWGNERSSRFRMAREPEFRAGAPGLQLSNPPTLPMLSLLFAPPTDVDAVFAELRKRNVVVDLRRPNVIRVAPAPLYNGFADVRAFVDCLAEALAAQKT
ncbi:kynureninase [Aureococcus anophagefferens]|nr:kynureninase [Aureococcus anophagefferens]